MSQILTMISGKGGSGKTTLALSLSQMLAECGIKVLLIDCDLATNGATYFFESKYKENFLTTSYVLYHENEPRLPILEVQEGFHFIPTSTHFSSISDKKNRTAHYDNIVRRLIEFRNLYDVIICDCQAGYSVILEQILPKSDLNLAVMEPDNISAKSLRVLYARLAHYLETPKTFQVFNKITPDERRLYEPLTSGTLFPLLPSISFNWEVRKAFSLLEIPQMRTTDAEFGKNVYKLAKVLFRQHESELYKYEKSVLEFEKRQLTTKVLAKETALRLKERPARRATKFFVMSVIPMAVFISALVILTLNSRFNSTESNYNYIIAVAVSVIFGITTSFVSILQEGREERIDRKKDRQELFDMQDQLRKVERRLSEYQQKDTKS